MREILQSLRAGNVELAESVARRPGTHEVLVRVLSSVVSAGTERSLVEFSRAGPIGKARQQPERVRQMVDKARSDGIGPTVEAIRSRLDEPLALGYASAGEVVAVGSAVTDIHVGDLVASNGPHAEIVAIPRTLCTVIPAGVPAEEAAFASLGAIALEAIRLAAPTLGERFVVTGLGLIGLLATQILRAHGCEVMGVDVDRRRLDISTRFGVEAVLASGDPVEAATSFSRGMGVDGVIIAASTPSNEPVHQAALMCRKRGRIVLVGVTGLELQRSDFYEKELSFQVSCSYGPGRYDPSYEDAAVDYPQGFVRWTAGRNMEAVLDLIASGRLNVRDLISHRYPFTEAATAYEALTADTGALGIVLDYSSAQAADGARSAPAALDRDRTAELLAPTLLATTRSPSKTAGRVGVIGAGGFARQVLLPALVATEAPLVVIATSGGASASWAARRFGIGRVTNDVASLMTAPDIDVVFVVTRHDSHADLVIRALDSGKHVFVEKPLAIDADGLERVVAAYENAAAGDACPCIGIGFNRRFSPITRRMVELLTTTGSPRAITITVNAGPVPADHWVQDPLVGGGRIIGEACHFVDLARHLAGSPIIAVDSSFLDRPGPPDSAVITLRHGNGSVSTIGYFANGNRRFPKERVTVFAGGRALVNDNFRRLTGYGWPGFRRLWLRKQDKGHAAGVAAFIAAVRGEQPPPIPFDEIIEVTAATLLACRQE